MWNRPTATKFKNTEGTAAQKSPVEVLAELLKNKFDLSDEIDVTQKKDGNFYITIPDQGHYSDGTKSKVAEVKDFFSAYGLENGKDITTSHPIKKIDHIVTTHITLSKSLQPAIIQGLELFKPLASKPAHLARC